MIPSFLQAKVPPPRLRLPNRPEHHLYRFLQGVVQVQGRDWIRMQAPWVVAAQESEERNQVQASCPLQGHPSCDFRRWVALKGPQVVANLRSAHPMQATLACESPRRAVLPFASW